MACSRRSKYWEGNGGGPVRPPLANDSVILSATNVRVQPELQKQPEQNARINFDNLFTLPMTIPAMVQ